MTYFIAFLEGIVTFVSPCLLPMLPIYISYFMGENETNSKHQTLKNALGFIGGFTFVFLILGAFAGTVGYLLIEHKNIVNLITGLLMILFGLNFIGLIRIPFLNKSKQTNVNTTNLNFGTSFLFGSIFSISWTPCVGAFLGSALMLASTKNSAFEGILMLLFYSVGLGIPFLLSALLMERLKKAFDFIKQHYRVINFISGLFLVIIGITMMTGTFGYFLQLLSN